MTGSFDGNMRAAPWWRRRFVCVVIWAVVTLGAVAVSSSAQAFEVGGVGGGNWNLLSQPTDLEGEYTLLWGSAFSGFGGLVGATVAEDLVRFEGASVGMTADLMYGYHRGTGFARGSGWRIDMELRTHVVRLPVMARVRAAEAELGPILGIGVEPIVGFASSASTEETGVDQPLQQIETTPAASVAGVLALGFEFDVGDEMVVPLDARMAWNPFVGSSTEDRFRDFESAENPGEYRVMFDWQFLVVAGMRWRL